MQAIYSIKNSEISIFDVRSNYNSDSSASYVFEPAGAPRKNIEVPAVPSFANSPTCPKIIKPANPWTFWDTATKLESVRLQRDYLLGLSDWRVIKATETQTPESQAWLDYRQALRDFPNLVNVNLPIEQIVWPQPPS